MESRILHKYEQETMDLKNMGTEGIDDLVSPSRWCIRLPREEVVSSFDAETKRLSQEIIDSKIFYLREGIRYGETERQGFDVLSRTEKQLHSPLVVFFHGGYWMAMRRQQFYHVGKPLVMNGVTFVTVGYDLAPEVSMSQIVSQAASALERIIDMAVEANCRDIYLAGHSAGGHLCIMAASCLNRLPDLSLRIKGFILMSGVFDLRPIQLSTDNETLKISDKEAKEYSPLTPECVKRLNQYFGHSRYMIIIPEHDAPEFWRQGNCFHQVLLEQQMHSELLELKGRDHFDYVEKLVDPGYDLSMKILNFVNGLDK